MYSLRISIFQILVIFLSFFKLEECTSILFFRNIASFPLTDALQKRCHQLIYISPLYLRSLQVNCSTVVPKSMTKTMNSLWEVEFNIEKKLPRAVYSYPAATLLCKNLLTCPELMMFFEKTEKLDLVVLNNCYGNRKEIDALIRSYSNDSNMLFLDDLASREGSLESNCKVVPITFHISGDHHANSKMMENIGGSMDLLMLPCCNKLENSSCHNSVNRMKEQMLSLRQILLERPMPPVDLAVWWKGYVLRHKDTTHLRGPVFDQYWFQRRLLDAWAFILSAILVNLTVLIGLFIKCFNFAIRTKAQYDNAVLCFNSLNYDSLVKNGFISGTSSIKGIVRNGKNHARRKGNYNGKKHL